MTITIKYFEVKNKDGVVSKDIGWVLIRKSQNLHVQEVNGEAKVLKDEWVSHTFSRLPKAFEVKEITKEDYDKLDISAETYGQKLKRMGSEATLQKLEVKHVPEPVSLREVAVAELSKSIEVKKERDKVKDKNLKRA